MSDVKRDWTTKELAQAAGVNERYIRQILAEGKLEGYKRARLWLVPYQVGSDWLEARKSRDADRQ